MSSQWVLFPAGCKPLVFPKAAHMSSNPSPIAILLQNSSPCCLQGQTNCLVSGTRFMYLLSPASSSQMTLVTQRGFQLWP